MSTKVFITGGTGFLGAYIIQNLVQKGIPVRALRRSGKLPFFLPSDVASQVEWMEGDVLDVVALDEAMKGIDAVIHSAAVVSFFRADRSRMYAVNEEGTANVVNLALENGVRRLVHVSSVAALGRTAKAEKVSEEKKWVDNDHNTHYAISKHLAELQAWRGFAEGLEGVILNPSTILGFGNWHQTSCAIFKNAYREFPWYTKGMNGFVAVEDVAEAAVQMLLSDLNARRFIVSADNVSFQQLFNMIADSMGKKRPRLEATPILAGIALRLEALKALFTGKKPLLSKETARIAQSRTEFDNSAMLEALPGFAYTPLPEVINRASIQYLQALKEGVQTL